MQQHILAITASQFKLRYGITMEDYIRKSRDGEMLWDDRPVEVLEDTPPEEARELEWI